jgi:hypothetical protein
MSEIKITKSVQTISLEQGMVDNFNSILGIKVNSVALPPNYKNRPKTEAETLDWLFNKVKNTDAFAYTIRLKYGHIFTKFKSKY